MLSFSGLAPRPVSMRSADPPVSTVLFDLDGVLVDSMPTMRAALAEAWMQVGCVGTPDFDAFRQQLGRPLGDIAQQLGWPPGMISIYLDAAIREIGATTCYPGVVRLLDELASRTVAVGVVTGKDGRRTRALLALLGLARRIEVVVGGDETDRGKPDPQPVYAALDRLKARPGETLMVGDMLVDLAAGRAAGCRVAAVTWGYGDPVELRAAKPDFVVSSSDELLTVLEGRLVSREKW